MYINSSLVVVSQQQLGGAQLCVTCYSSYTQGLFTFFSLFLSPFFFCSQHSFKFWFSSYCFLSHSAISFLIVVSALSFLVPLSHSGFIHLLHHHQAGFPARLSSAPVPPELLVLLLPLEQLQFTHWWWGFHLEHLVSHWRKHPREPTVHSGLVLTTILHVTIW